MESPIKEIILRCWTDSAFKEKFLNEPESVFSEYSIKTGPKAKLRIVENDDDSTYFILPAAPDLSGMSQDEISQIIDNVLAEQLVLPGILD